MYYLLVYTHPYAEDEMGEQAVRVICEYHELAYALKDMYSRMEDYGLMSDACASLAVEEYASVADIRVGRLAGLHKFSSPYELRAMLAEHRLL